MNCRHVFTYRNPGNKLHRERKWFRDWIVEGYSVRQMNTIGGRSVRALKRVIAHWLSRLPPEQPLPFGRMKYLVADGTYLRHEVCVYAVTDRESGLVAAYRFDERENYAMARSAFDGLKARGCEPAAATVDGNRQVMRALRDVWPGIVVQRCLYHILRQGTSWLRRFPKDPAAAELRRIFLGVTAIADRRTKAAFLRRFRAWERRYGGYVRSLDGRNKVWGDMKQARSLMLRAIPDMFHYLDDPGIAPTSNMQEGLFSTAKILFRGHRGVSKKNRAAYFAWYFYFKNEKIINRFGY